MTTLDIIQSHRTKSFKVNGISLISHHQNSVPVYQVTLGEPCELGSVVIVKEDTLSKNASTDLKETDFYLKLQNMQGNGIPRMLKASWSFTGKVIGVMVLDLRGVPIEFHGLSFDDDVIRQLRLIFAQISRYGIVYCDDNKTNMLVQNGKVSVIDFADCCEPRDLCNKDPMILNANNLHGILRRAGVRLEELDLKNRESCAKWLGCSMGKCKDVDGRTHNS
jgi:hypothetical protein